MTSTVNLPEPLSLDGNVNQNWIKFHNRFEIYLGASGREQDISTIANEDDKKRYLNSIGKLLLNIAGEEATALAVTFGLSDENKFNYNQLVTKFAAYAKTEVNDTYERFIFNSCVQQEGQTTDQYVTELKKKVKHCGYGDKEDEFIRDRLVVGLRDKKMQEALFRVKNLTLDKAIQDCRVAEQSRHYTRELRSASNGQQNNINQNVDAVRFKFKKKPHPEGKQEGFKKFKKKCSKCNYNHAYGKCPAFGQTCMKCKGTNHFAAKCEENKKNIKAHSTEEKAEEKVDSIAYEVYFTDHVKIDSLLPKSRTVEYRQEIKVEGIPVCFKLDPGAHRSVLPLEVFQSLKTSKCLKKANVKIKPYGKNTPTLTGEVGFITLECNVNRITREVVFLVAEDGDVPLFSAADCEDFKLITRHIPIEEVKLVPTNEEEFIKDNPDIFRGLGKFPGQHPVLTRPDAEQVIRPALRKPTSVNSKLKPCLEALETRGIIKKVDHLSPDCWECEWTTIESELCKNWISLETESSYPGLWKEIHKIGSRTLQRLRLKLLKYDLQVEHIPGKEMHVADHLSRSFSKDDVEDDPSMLEVVHSMTMSLPISPKLQEDLVSYTTQDEVLQLLIGFQTNGWPSNITHVPDRLIPYFKIRTSLFYEDGIVFFNDDGQFKIVVPSALRKSILALIHHGHMGTDKCKSRAKQAFYWPLMLSHVASYVQECQTCSKYRPMTQKLPLLPHAIPKLPWEQLHMDIASFGGSDYLVITCAYSKWLEICKLRGKSSSDVIQVLKDVFSTHGDPMFIHADNNPFNSVEFRRFADSINCKVITSSPNFPRSNGRAEKAVNVAKLILKKSREERQDYKEALKEFRNTIVPSMGASPAQILFSRRLKTKLPIQKSELKPQVQRQVPERIKQQEERTKAWYNKNARRSEPVFKPGDPVLIKSSKKENWKPAIVKQKLQEPRSYLVSTPSGDLRRTAEHLSLNHGAVPEEDDLADYDFVYEQPVASHVEEIPVIPNEQDELQPDDPVIEQPDDLDSEVQYQLIVPEWLYSPYYFTQSGRPVKPPSRFML